MRAALETGQAAFCVDVEELVDDTTAEDLLAIRDEHESRERLLLDAMNGDNTLFVRRDEAEQAWKWVDEVSEAWEGAGFKPHDYRPGTWGPDEAEMLLARTGRRWNTTDA